MGRGGGIRGGGCCFLVGRGVSGGVGEKGGGRTGLGVSNFRGAGLGVVFLVDEVVEEVGEGLEFFVGFGEDEGGGVGGEGGGGVSVAGGERGGELVDSYVKGGDIPKGGHGDVDLFVGERLLEVVDGPGPYGLPVGCSASDNKGGVFGDEAHKLEGAGFMVEFDDGRAVELVVGRDKLGDGFVHFGGVSFFCPIGKVSSNTSQETLTLRGKYKAENNCERRCSHVNSRW